LLNNIKQLLLDRYIDMRLRLTRQADGLLDFPRSVKSVKTVLIVFTNKLNDEHFYKQFSSGLYAIFGDIKVSAFNPGHLSADDKNWFGLPAEKHLAAVRDEHFDLVVDLNQEQDRLSTYLCAISAAPLKLNLASGRYDHVYNLHFRSSKSATASGLIKNTLNYLKTLKEVA